ncbi:phosphotransferase enzyme family protein [Stipitochalara longipes BDJ]|nr:phosphotransferase enzyme family protein [Stipitochalara longipes BDJ]
MANLGALPFFAAPDLLPAPLPTMEAITTSQDILKEFTGRRIVRVGTHFIVKYGVNVSVTEGENMLFVKQFSTIQIPTLYAIYSSHYDGESRPTNYIVIENIPGDTLESRWVSLDEEAKSAIAGQLRTFFTQLRQIPSPGYFGCLKKRPFEDYVFWTGDDPDWQVVVSAGPFDSEEQFLEAVVQKYRHENPEFQKSEYYSRILPLVLRNHAPVFSHGDFQRKNIVVRNDGTLVMIDWEAAGWYPSFWEYAMTLFACRWDDDWHSWVVKILDEYPNEYAWMNMLLREIWS